MYYCLVFYPVLETELIDQIRRKHDPTVDVVRPHVTVVFPVPERVGETELIDHIEGVLSEWRPFQIRLGGFHKSNDHWLLLSLAEGESNVKQLHRSLYTGVLAEYHRDDLPFVPHVGLGLFLKQDSRYDWDHPQEADFDEPRYEEALREVGALPLGSGCAVNRLELVKIPDELVDWATGKRASIPGDCRALEVRGFRLRNAGP